MINLSFDMAICSNCLMIICNDDASGMSESEERASREGIAKMEGNPVILSDETDGGTACLGFSWKRCQCCNALPGERFAIALLP